jgi:hypothetical protein
VAEDRIFVSVKEAANMLGGITPWQVYRLLDAQEIESRYIGKRRMVVLESLREYAANLPTQASA